MSGGVGEFDAGDGQVPNGHAALRAEFAALRKQTEITQIRLDRAQRRLQRRHNRGDNDLRAIIRDEINTWWNSESTAGLRRQVSFNFGDQTQKPVEKNSVPNLRGRSAQSEALESLCAHGLLRKADVSEVHPDLPTLHGLRTRYVAGVSAFRRKLQRMGWVRRAVPAARPSDTTGGDAA